MAIGHFYTFFQFKPLHPFKNFCSRMGATEKDVFFNLCIFLNVFWVVLPDVVGYETKETIIFCPRLGLSQFVLPTLSFLLSVCLYVCMSECLYVCMSVCLYVCMSVRYIYIVLLLYCINPHIYHVFICTYTCVGIRTTRRQSGELCTSQSSLNLMFRVGEGGFTF